MGTDKEKKKVLFVYPSMLVGGSTTSLLSVLNSIDYEKYEVDLLFFNEKGELFDLLPEEVYVLPFACKYPDDRTLKKHRALSLQSYLTAVQGKIYAKCKKNRWVAAQFGSKDKVRYCNEQKKKYDIAISFLEFWPMYYLVDKVSATEKVAWIHTDCSKLDLISKYENKVFEKLDKIVLISPKCKNIFDSCFPNWKYKSMVVENFLSEKLIKKRSEEIIDFETKKECLNMVTACRIDFGTKGLDRGVNIIESLCEWGYCGKLHWYIIGDGPDFVKLSILVSQKKLSHCITLLGKQKNPFPYEKKCDVFFLPSYFEGKPMAVTEAQILGLVPIVAEYSSASEQIIHREDGLILENSEEGILEGVKGLLDHPELLEKLKKGLLKKSFQSIGKEQFLSLLP